MVFWKSLKLVRLRRMNEKEVMLIFMPDLETPTPGVPNSHPAPANVSGEVAGTILMKYNHIFVPITCHRPIVCAKTLINLPLHMCGKSVGCNNMETRFKNMEFTKRFYERVQLILQYHSLNTQL